MKIKILLLLVFGFQIDSMAQGYNFSVRSGNYEDLSGSISLNNGFTWDDPQFAIPIGFDFQFYDSNFDTIYIEDYGLGALLTPDTSETGIIPFIIPYNLDLIDRGYDFTLDSITETSLSNISYLLTGNAGSRILKIEWNNAGFYWEYEEDNVSSDFVNFQLWLYEGSNDIEIHFGPKSITNPESSFDFQTGSMVGIIPAFDITNDDPGDGGYLLSGNPSSPDLIEINSGDDPVFLDGIIPEGTIYKFSPKPVSTNTPKTISSEITLFPNPVSTHFNVFYNPNIKLETIRIFDLHGKIVKSETFSGSEINIQDLPTGTYLVNIETDKGPVVKFLFKN